MVRNSASSTVTERLADFLNRLLRPQPRPVPVRVPVAARQPSSLRIPIERR